MKAGWKYVDFNKCIQKIPKQKQVKSKDYLTSGLFPIVSQEMELVSGYWNDESFLYKIDKPIVVFGDHTKVIKYIDFDFVVGADGTQLLKPIDQLDTKFFYYFLKSIILRDLGYARHFKLLKQVPIPLPSLSEQWEIVAYLDKEFALIDALREKATLQLQAAKDLFQSALKQLLTPKHGWEEKKIGEVGKTQTGTTPSKSVPNNYGGTTPFIRPSEVDYDGTGGVKYDSEIKLSAIGALNGRMFDAGSILMVCIGATIGKTGYITQEVSCNQQINVVTPYNGYCGKFIYYYLISPDFRAKVIKEGTSSQATLPIINKSKWEKLSVFLPPLLEQEEIVRKLDALSEKCRQLEENYRQTITLCNDLKQALLRQVFE